MLRTVILNHLQKNKTECIKTLSRYVPNSRQSFSLTWNVCKQSMKIDRHSPLCSGFAYYMIDEFEV